METRPFGPTGLRVSALGFGAAEIGFENTTDRTVDAILGVALDTGLNVIDTAAMYSDSEEKIGRAMRGRRNQYLLFTKCGRCPPTRRTFAGFLLRARRKLQRAVGEWNEDDPLDWQPRALEWNIEQSLRRLQTDWIDLIQLDGCSEKTLRRGEVIEVLQHARQAGKARHIGYSGDGPAALYAIECGQFEALEISVNLADEEAFDLALPLAHQHNLGVIAKRPLANCLWRCLCPEDRLLRAYWERLQTLRYDFLHSERAVEIALRFTVSASGVHTAIVGTTNPRHLREDADFVGAGVLDKDQFDAIRARWKQVARPDWVGQT
jgi:aryl-alcohol dehydrogenase-like predicted oxidoreductase